MISHGPYPTSLSVASERLFVWETSWQAVRNDNYLGALLNFLFGEISSTPERNPKRFEILLIDATRKSASRESLIATGGRLQRQTACRFGWPLTEAR